MLRLLEGIAYPNPRLVVSGNHAAPWQLLELADKSLPEYRLFQLNAQPGIPVRDGVRHETPFVGPGMRGLPTLDYLPARLSLVPQILATTHRPDLVLLHTSAPRDGKVSLGIEVNILPAAVEQAIAAGGLIVAQINTHMPYTYGDGELPVDLIDFAVEHDAPLPSPGSSRDPSLAHCAASIGERVAATVTDGATLQTGIGAIPDAVLAGLTGHRGLRVWSEMISDGVVELAARRALDEDSPVISSFLFGSPELYTWADRNPRLRMTRTETVNDPRGSPRSRPWSRSTRRCRSISTRRLTPLMYVVAFTRVSEGRPTSSSARCTRTAGRRSSRCRRGTPSQTPPPSCRGSPPRRPRSSTPPSSPSRAARICSAAASTSRPPT
jgi:hypothetical protein